MARSSPGSGKTTLLGATLDRLAGELNIDLRRDVPEASTMWKAEDKVKAILPCAAKRGIRIIKGGRS